MRSDVSAMDRIGNGVVAGFIATLALSVLHEAVELLTDAVGVDTPAIGWVFHFFVGTLLWGGGFGFAHDYLPGPSWLRGILFAAGAAVIVLFAIMPLTGAGLLCLNYGIVAPFIVVLFHLGYGAVLGAVYGKLIDTEEGDLRHVH